MEAQRQLVADASHELRTPLTSLRTNVELLARPNALPDDERERVLADVDRADRGAVARSSPTSSTWRETASRELAIEDVGSTSSSRTPSSARDGTRPTSRSRPTLEPSRSCAGRRSASTGRSRTSSTTPPSGARRAASRGGRRRGAVHGPRPWARHPRGRPAARLRPLLPRDGSPRHARLRARSRNRPPGGGVARRPCDGRAADGGGTIFRLAVHNGSLGAFQEPLSKRCFDADHGDRPRHLHEAHPDRCSRGRGRCSRRRSGRSEDVAASSTRRQSATPSTQPSRRSSA